MNPIIAIVGRPNVGKSTLFNRLVGGRRALTLDISGVTRDRHYGHATWEGRNFICVDTGGLSLFEGGEKDLEKKIRDQVDLAIHEASIILLVMDGSQGLLHEEEELVVYLRRFDKKVLFVINKIDEPKHEERLSEFYELGGDVYPVSSEHGYRVNDLLDKIVQELPPETPEPSREGQIKVALVGRPNVGKSSLLNHLLGEERVVVHDQPGTTTDVIDTEVEVDSQKYLLIDTAGIRRHGTWSSKLERYSVLSALKAVERADICLLLLDAHEGIHKQDAHVAGHIQEAKKGLIVVWNKWDLLKKSKDTRKERDKDFDYKLKFLSYVPRLSLSAKTGWGCEDLWPAIHQLYQTCGKRIPTAQVNEALDALLEAHNPPIFRGKPVKFFYATQTKTFPPTFVVFVNEPKGVHFSFERYLMNGLRKAFDFNGAPIEIFFRRKK